MTTKQRIKLIVILAVEFIAIAVLLLLIFFAGKQSYTVKFDLNGGTLISGDLEQSVRQGGRATPPTAAKEGHYFLKWSESYDKVTRDMVIKAVWEYETSPGIEYNIIPNSNYCTVSGCFKGMQGDVYIGAYNGNLRVLGIEDNAFKDCTGITRIHLLDGIVKIGNNAFSGCTSLESIELPDTLAILGTNAFKNCTSLTEVTIPESLTTLPDYAFVDCAALTTCNLPSTLTNIGKYAFKNCTAMTSIVFPESLTGIMDNAFINCSALTAVDLPSSLTTIGTGAFKQCTTLTMVEIPGSVLTLGDSAFRQCTALEKVILHEGLTSIGSYAFYECTNLAELTVPSTVPFESVGVNAFEKTQLVFDVEYPTEEEIEIPIVRPPWGPIKGEDFIIDSDGLIDLNGV